MGIVRCLDKAWCLVALAGCAHYHHTPLDLPIGRTLAVAAANPTEVEGRYRGLDIRMTGTVAEIGYITQSALVSSSMTSGEAHAEFGKPKYSSSTTTTQQVQETRYAYVKVVERGAGWTGGGAACVFDNWNDGDLHGVRRGDPITVLGVMERADTTQKPEIVLTRCAVEK